MAQPGFQFTLLMEHSHKSYTQTSCGKSKRKNHLSFRCFPCCIIGFSSEENRNFLNEVTRGISDKTTSALKQKNIVLYKKFCHEVIIVARPRPVTQTIDGYCNGESTPSRTLLRQKVSQTNPRLQHYQQAGFT